MDAGWQAVWRQYRWSGLVDAIKALDWKLDNSELLIIGAGGATRGVIYPLVQAGAKNCHRQRAEQLI